MPPAANPRILILTGAPGVGKSAVAEILAARSARAVHLEVDAFFDSIRSGYIAPWKSEAHQQNRSVMQVVAAAADGYAAAGYFTVVDGIVLPDWFLEPLLDDLRPGGHSVDYAVLRAPLTVCQTRAEGRASRPLTEAAVVEQLWSGFADLGRLEDHVVELGDTDAEAAADLVSRRLAPGELAVWPWHPYRVTDLPIACSLGPADLDARLQIIAAFGTENLVDRGVDGQTQVLRFRPGAEVRRSLEEIVAAESQCCSFLSLEITGEEDVLILRITAPAEAETLAAGLAAVFAGARA